MKLFSLLSSQPATHKVSPQRNKNANWNGRRLGRSKCSVCPTWDKTNSDARGDQKSVSREWYCYCGVKLSIALRWHPDKVEASLREEAEDKFKSIKRAYDVLSDGICYLQR